MNSRFAAYAFCALFFCFSANAAVLSFPGALGFGNAATGGRGGTVYHVTNLNDAGAGSFRDAVSKGNRIVVFDVGGYISLKSAVTVSGNITIAGQTAPGEGIAIKSGKVSLGANSNIIIRYVRFRPGSETAGGKKDVAINLLNAYNVIIDHCVFEFAPWNNIDGVQTKHAVTDITFQYNLIANPTGQQFGAHCESSNGQWSWFYNAFVNSHNRNPLDKTNSVFVNNVNYNYGAAYTTHTSTKFKHDLVGNYFIFGPVGTKNTWYQVDKNQSIYYKGNMLDSDRNGSLNGKETTPSWYQGTGTILSSPWSDVTKNLTIYSAATAFRLVSSWAGTLPYDQVDALIWKDVASLGKSGKLYTSQTATGLSNNGYGVITGGTKDKDTDNDGVPDYFEKAVGTDATKDDAMKTTSDGYANIERYINWKADMHSRVSENSKIDVNLVDFTKGFQTVSPTYSVKNVKNGTATVSGNKAAFTPSANFTGIASFDFTVKGNDGTEWSSTVYVLVEPDANSTPVVINPVLCVWSSDSSLDWTRGDKWSSKAEPAAKDTAVVRKGEVRVSKNIEMETRVEKNGTFRVVGSVSASLVRLQGGTLKSHTSSALYVLNSKILAEDSSEIFVGSQDTSVFNLNAAISGKGALIKTQNGVLLLTKSSPDYSGHWTVAAGTLKLSASKAAGSGTVTVLPGAKLSLNSAGALSGASLKLSKDGSAIAQVVLGAADTVTALDLNGVQAKPGTYTAPELDGYASGSGTLTVLKGESSTAIAPITRNVDIRWSVSREKISVFSAGHGKLVILNAFGQILASAEGSEAVSLELRNLPRGTFFARYTENTNGKAYGRVILKE